MPRYLTEQDIADFRAELCKVATERFARFGYEGVTMRQLADALGCSPKTPYRYFKDKADILATVRAQAFEKFSDALEAAVTNAPGDPVSKAQAVGEAYHRFAMKNPHAYRIMFDIEAPIDDSHPELGPKARHAATYITSTAERLAKAGLIDVDPTLFGWSMWAATHGLVMLQQAGMLEHAPDYRTLAQFHGALMLRGAAPAAPVRKPGKKR
jgi:AcrR family transcriptional regulator